MPRETNAAKRERAIEVCERLNRRYGPVECFLDHENPFRLLIAVLLSAQTTDAQVNKVTPKLFAQWPTPEAMAVASRALSTSKGPSPASDRHSRMSVATTFEPP